MVWVTLRNGLPLTKTDGNSDSQNVINKHRLHIADRTDSNRPPVPQPNHNPQHPSVINKQTNKEHTKTVEMRPTIHVTSGENRERQLEGRQVTGIRVGKTMFILSLTRL